jgi:hypothetical protein
MRRVLVILLLLLSSCDTAAPAGDTSSIRVAYSPAAAPWVSDLYNCAGKNIVIAESRTADDLDPGLNMTIRIGLPVSFNSPAFQIGTEEILVVVNRISPITTLTLEQVRHLFGGQFDNWSQLNTSVSGKVQVWVYPSGEDIEQVFEGTVLRGIPVSSFARLANNPDEMSRAVADDQNAIGVLPRLWKMGNVTTVFAAASVPVLALTPAEPSGEIRRILTCLSD